MYENILNKLRSSERQLCSWKTRVIGMIGIIALIVSSCTPRNVELIKDDKVTRSVVNHTEPGVVDGLSVVVNIEHPALYELDLSLSHGKKTVNIAEYILCDKANMHVIFSDFAPIRLDDACYMDDFASMNSIVLPSSPLHVFDGDPIAGEWILYVYDGSIGGKEGAITHWDIVP